MIDIISADENGLGILDTQAARAANILSVQLGALEYAPELGIDLKYFLTEDFRFQNASFKSYLIQVLTNQGINVSEVAEVIDNLFTTMTFNLSPQETEGSFIAR